MTKKKNYYQKCAVRHCAPTDKKCTRIEEIAEKVIDEGDGIDAKTSTTLLYI